MGNISFRELIRTNLESTCHHCNQKCVAIKLSNNTIVEIDFYGVECLQDVDQAIYEGMSICPACYEKEGGII